MKEHLVRHGSKHKIQVHATKRNKWQQKQKQATDTAQSAKGTIRDKTEVAHHT